jgi:hypothetical protein
MTEPKPTLQTAISDVLIMTSRVYDRFSIDDAQVVIITGVTHGLKVMADYLEARVEELEK